MNRMKTQGVGLVELMITLLVFSIGIVALLKYQSNYFYYYDISKQRSEAMSLAKNRIATLRDFEVIPTTTGKVAYTDIASGTTTSQGNNTTYTITTTVTSHSSPDYKNIDVKVSWTDRRNANQSVTLSTIIASIDPASSGLAYN